MPLLGLRPGAGIPSLRYGPSGDDAGLTCHAEGIGTGNIKARLRRGSRWPAARIEQGTAGF